MTSSAVYGILKFGERGYILYLGIKLPYDEAKIHLAFSRLNSFFDCYEPPPRAWVGSICLGYDRAPFDLTLCSLIIYFLLNALESEFRLMATVLACGINIIAV